MSNTEQVTKLQGLLARIQRNATLPRSGAPLPPPAAFAPPPPMPPAPPIVAPAPAYEPPAPAYEAAAPAPLDQGVDDLLDAPPAAADIDVPLDTLPPVAEVPQPTVEAYEAEPIPLVNASAPQEPAPVDDTFGLDSEVSEVRVTTALRDPAPEVTVAAIEAEAEPEPIAAEELSEDDLVEVTEGTPAPATTDVDIDFEDEEEQPPASSQRSKVASTMDEALAAAAEQLDQEHDVPLKTPPPESGPQEAPPVGIAAPAAPDVDSLLGSELEIPTRDAPAPAAALGPTPEQLGQTIELEEAHGGPTLELAEHQAQEAPAAFAPAPVEELEVALPARDVVGGYDDSLQPPPEALSDLEAHRRRLEEDIAPPPESLATLPSVQPGPAPEIVPVAVQAAPEAPVQPELVARAIPEGVPESFTTVRESFRPQSFVELLDASLALNGD